MAFLIRQKSIVGAGTTPLTTPVADNLTTDSATTALSSGKGKYLEENKANKVGSPTVGNLVTLDAAGDLVDSGIESSKINTAKVLYVYQDFAAGAITGTSVTLTSTSYNDLSFNASNVVNSSFIVRSDDVDKYVYTGALGFFSNVVKVSSISGATVSLSGVPHSSYAVRIYYRYSSGYFPVNYAPPSSRGTAAQSDLYSDIPCGTVIPWLGDVTALPSGFIYANGAAISRSTYAKLFSCLGTYFGVGDGSSTYNLPDLRGQFLRGTDSSRGKDPDAATRTTPGGSTDSDTTQAGTEQGWQIQSHSHQYLRFYNNLEWASNAWNTNESTGDETNQYNWQWTANTGGNQTNPTNVAVHYLIKFS